MREEVLRGYVLEEVVAKMLQVNDYRLISDESDDPEALLSKGHTLYVRGRGTDHQADALGDLTTPIPFGLPVRLFVEAKHLTRPVDLPVLRNAHGVIHDVNQCYATPRTGARPAQRYDYRYAIFSTSGFTAQADDFARAHQISLHDLSVEKARPLIEAVKTTTGALRSLITVPRDASFPLHAVRLALRAALGTLGTPPASTQAATDLEDINARLQTARAQHPALEALEVPLAQLGAALVSVSTEAPRWDYLMGYSDGQSVLALRPESVKDFEQYCAEKTSVEVEVGYEAGRGAGRGEFVLTPKDRGPGSFELRFGAPNIVVRDVLTAAAPRRERPEPAKPANITVFRDQRAVRLSYIPRQLDPDQDVDATSVARWLKQVLSDPTPDPAGDSPVAEPVPDLVEADGDPMVETDPATDVATQSSAQTDAQTDAQSTAQTDADVAAQRDADLAADDGAELLFADDEVDGDADDDADGNGPVRVRWKASEARALLAQLERIRPDRALVLLALVEGRKRGLRRSEVLQAMGRDGEEALNGVVRPFGTAMAALRETGELREEVLSPIEPKRWRGRIAGYRLVPEVREALRRAAREGTPRG